MNGLQFARYVYGGGAVGRQKAHEGSSQVRIRQSRLSRAVRPRFDDRPGMRKPDLR